MPDVTERNSDLQGSSDHLGLRSENEIKEEPQTERREGDGPPTTLRHLKDHPPKQIIGNMESGIKTRGQLQNEVEFSAFISEIEPTCIEEALNDCDWIIAMQEELNQFRRNQVWDLVPKPKNQSIIAWCFRTGLRPYR